jgi:hypothetical protein
MQKPRAVRVTWVLVLAALVSHCGGSPAPAPSPLPTLQPQRDTEPAPPPPAPPPAVSFAPPETLVGAGDIAMCDTPGAEQTARLLDAIPGTVFTAGDNTYPSATERSFKDCYGPTWGRHRSRTRPSPGNHDYDASNAAYYYQYFGANAGDGRGYYSYRLGDWLVLSLNSNVAAGEGSPQYQWVESTLRDQPSRCALAYWHHPVITSGPNGDHPHMQALWGLLVERGVELVMSGHDHIYERYTPMDAHLGPDPVGGTRLFIAGTGGARPYPIVARKPQSEVQSSVWGVLKLTLRGDAYDWEFVAVPGTGFHDAGTASCR